MDALGSNDTPQESQEDSSGREEELNAEELSTPTPGGPEEDYRQKRGRYCLELIGASMVNFAEQGLCSVALRRKKGLYQWSLANGERKGARTKDPVDALLRWFDRYDQDMEEACEELWG